MGKKQKAISILTTTLENADEKFSKRACIGFLYEPKQQTKKEQKHIDKKGGYQNNKTRFLHTITFPTLVHLIMKSV
ncbi:MAG TPA: hypothetical protein VJY54_10180 [Lachnospiraceae bacterium]|nr:hypothetical protein [Lachnospiraceae bacterium]